MPVRRVSFAICLLPSVIEWNPMLHPASICLRLVTFASFTLSWIATTQAQEQRITLTRNVDHESIWIGDVELLRYNKVALPAPIGIDPNYARSGYIHPIRTPSGVIVTGDFAPDHAHQHALFSAWTNTTYHDQKVDFWNQQKGTGLVSFLRTARNLEASDHGEFVVIQKHDALKIADKPKTILKEVWRVSAEVAANRAGQDHFVFNIEQTQTNVTDKPLTIKDFHYGGMALRGHNQWFTQQSAEALQKLNPKTTKPGDYPSLEITRHRFITNEGKRRMAGNLSRPNWVDLSGLVDGHVVGITVMSHPDNFRHPQPVRLHPTKPYFCFSPCAAGAFEIGPGETYQARYRYVVHDGEPNVDQLNQLWKHYASQ